MGELPGNQQTGNPNEAPRNPELMTDFPGFDPANLQPGYS